MSAIVLVTFLSLLGAPPQTPSSPLQVRLQFAETTIAVGVVPTPKVTLFNSGSAPLAIVVPGDGSEVGWRTPIVGW